MWITALLMGLTGSLHCAGMCSPLIMAVTNVSRSVLINRFVYNSGRILTYGAIGTLFSSFGSQLSLAPYQNILSVGFGMLLIGTAIFKVDRFKITAVTKMIQRLTTFIKIKFTFFFSKRNTSSTFFLGMLNGVLPCGMTMLAFSYCLLLNKPYDGFVFMLAFGTGTLPVMIGFTSLLSILIKKFQFSLSGVTHSLLLLSGIILIARVFIHAGIEAHQTGSEFIDIVICGSAQ